MNATTNPTAYDVAEWLKSLSTVDNQIIDVKPVKVTIGRKTYLGAIYTQLDTYTSTERAVTEGRVKAGERYASHRIYLVGQNPKTRRALRCFTWESGLSLDERTSEHTNEWYTSCHYSGEDVNHYHPFGASFMLTEWLEASYGYYKGWKIDTGERFAYARYPMSVEYLPSQP